MPSIHFHPIYAWNLIEDLGRAGILPSDSLRGYPERRLHQGRQEGWINNDNRQTACWMFTFANHVVLPGEVDVHVDAAESLVGHIDWGRGLLASGDLSMKMPRFDEGLDMSSAASIAALASRSNASVQDVESILEWWRRLREFDAYVASKFRSEFGSPWSIVNAGYRRQIAEGKTPNDFVWKAFPSSFRADVIKLLRNDPLREKARFSSWEDDVTDAANFLRYANRFANVGCPSLTKTNRTYSYHEPQDPENYTALVRYYFSKVRIPAPESASEALRYRNNDRVVQWREKIEDWSRNLNSNKTDLKSIEQEIADASGYIEGARGIRTAVSRISPWITLGLATLLEVLPEFPFKREATIGVLTIEGLHRIAPAIEANVTGRNPLKYGWLLVEPPRATGD